MCFKAAALTLGVGILTAGSAQSTEKIDQTLALIEQWLADGVYDTSAQVEADVANDVPENLKHRLMYQVFHKVDIKWLEGLTYFQQGSSDGTLDTTLRSGIVQYFPDPGTDTVRMRELNFNTVENWVDAYKDPVKIATITADDVKWDGGCDFFIVVNSEASEIRGPMRDGTCKLPEEQFGMVLVAEDELAIRPGEIWFLGRYVDENGTVMWGTESDELNKLILQQ
jgi:hypothetical protein